MMEIEQIHYPRIAVPNRPNLRTITAAIVALGVTGCYPDGEQSSADSDRTTAGTAIMAAAAEPLTCDTAPPPLPATGTLDASTIPDVQADLRTVPATSLVFDSQEIVSDLTYLYGIEAADFDCDGGWDISFWDSWSSSSPNPPGAVGYLLKSNSTIQQITDRDTWPGLIQTGLYLFERHKALDINGDGFLDIIGAGNSNSAFIAYLNPGASDPNALWTRRYLHTLSPGPINLELHDMDGDGLTDVVITMRINSDGRGRGAVGGLAWLKNPGPGSAERWVKQTIGPSEDLDDPRNLQVADFDGNGKPDVYVADTSTGLSSTYFQTAQGTWVRDRFNSGSLHGHFGTSVDENGDGVPEIIQPVFLGMKFLRFDPQARSWTTQRIATFAWEGTVTFVSDVVVRDIDGDGTADIVFGIGSLSSSQTDPRRGGVFVMRQANGWQVESVDQANSSVVELKVLDYNGDGTVDIVVNYEYPENKLAIFYQRPAGS